MAAEVIMPKLGMSMVEGTVIAWKKKIGDPIAKGDGVVEINSEKIEMEVEAQADGILLAIVVAEGEVVPYGTVLGYIGQTGENIEQISHGVADSTANQEAVSKGNSLKISPVARKMAEEAGLQLDSIVGTGPQGRITKEDVEKALASRVTFPSEEPIPTPTSVPMKTVPAQETVERTPVGGMRKVIATRMLESLQQSAQLTMTAKADVTELLSLQKQLAAELHRRQEGKLTVTDFIARAVILSLKQHKQMNSAYLTDQQEPRIETYGHVHLGIAVALEKGLIVPVIPHADSLTLLDLSKALKSLGERARNNQLSSEEMKGSTFTISNLGAYGVEYFTPVLNPPEAGILGVGAVDTVPAFRGEELLQRSMLPLSLTFDHRVLDGAPAAQFLGIVREFLENPHSLLL